MEDMVIPTGFVSRLERPGRYGKDGESAAGQRLVPPKIGPDGQAGGTLSRRNRRPRKIYQVNHAGEPLKTPIVAFRNLGNLKFEDAGPAVGIDDPALHNGIALGDLDDDGGLDFVVNTSEAPRAFITTTGRRRGLRCG